MKERTLSDDEVSELGECLWDACREAEEKGALVTVTVMLTKPTMCPFGALIGGPTGHPSSYFPGPVTVALATGISRQEVDAFMRGFSEPLREDYDRRPMVELGALFRRQSESGGFSSPPSAPAPTSTKPPQAPSKARPRSSKPVPRSADRTGPR